MSFASRIGLSIEGKEGTLIIVAPNSTADILQMGRRIELMPVDSLICDLSGLTDADCGTVDALARLQLRARKLGRTISVRRVPTALHELIALAGLCEVLDCGD